jgi:hypothetical protein
MAGCTAWYRRTVRQGKKPWATGTIAACKVEAFNPATVPRGEMREIVKTDANGLKVRHFIGQDCFVKQMGRPGRRVKSFLFDRSALRP